MNVCRGRYLDRSQVQSSPSRTPPPVVAGSPDSSRPSSWAVRCVCATVRRRPVVDDAGQVSACQRDRLGFNGTQRDPALPPGGDLNGSHESTDQRMALSIVNGKARKPSVPFAPRFPAPHCRPPWEPSAPPDTRGRRPTATEAGRGAPPRYRCRASRTPAGPRTATPATLPSSRTSADEIDEDLPLVWQRVHKTKHAWWYDARCRDRGYPVTGPPGCKAKVQ
jgi:hypothetical protein